MKIFVLKNNTGEVIATRNAGDMFEAQVLFSKIKKLAINKLLHIFTIEEYEDKKILI